MKKFALIALVVFFLALPFLHLGKGVFLKEKGPSSIKRTKKTVQIKEISEDLYSQKSMAGNWILFLHYSNDTMSVDIRINDNGLAESKDPDALDNLQLTIDSAGYVKMSNERMIFEGIMNPEGNHLSGMVDIQGVRVPVPFSAFKILQSEENK
jgi:hypothetical protein